MGLTGADGGMAGRAMQGTFARKAAQGRPQAEAEARGVVGLVVPVRQQEPFVACQHLKTNTPDRFLAPPSHLPLAPAPSSSLRALGGRGREG